MMTLPTHAEWHATREERLATYFTRMSDASHTIYMDLQQKMMERSLEGWERIAGWEAETAMRRFGIREAQALEIIQKAQDYVTELAYVRDIEANSNRLRHRDDGTGTVPR